MGIGPTTDTLAALHLGVERRHEREAVLRRRRGERWEATPDRAREIQPSAPAVAHLASNDLLTHRDVVAHVRLRWSSSPARQGDVANAPRGVLSLVAHVALYGFVADGASCLSFGGDR
jgi:hypothetical protein